MEQPTKFELVIELLGTRVGRTLRLGGQGRLDPCEACGQEPQLTLEAPAARGLTLRPMPEQDGAG